MKFHETELGNKFFNKTIPALVDALREIAANMIPAAEMANNGSKTVVTPQEVAKVLVELVQGAASDYEAKRGRIEPEQSKQSGQPEQPNELEQHDEPEQEELRFQVISRAGADYLEEPLKSLKSCVFETNSLPEFLSMVWSSGRVEVVPPKELLHEQGLESSYLDLMSRPGIWGLIFHNDYGR